MSICDATIWHKKCLNDKKNFTCTVSSQLLTSLQNDESALYWNHLINDTDNIDELAVHNTKQDVFLLPITTHEHKFIRVL